MEKTKFSAVFIHGMFGWGMKTPMFNTAMYYWPVKSLDLTNANYHVVEVGVVSSDHDRACEAFYQLKGGRVDYGKDHSEQKGHARYGATYDNPMHPEWSEENPVHLIGHSFGGTTAIELYQLLCVDFFRVGSNHKWVKSIISIAAPLSGATLSPMLGSTMDAPTGFNTISYLLLCTSITLHKFQEQFPFLQGLYETRMSQWSDSIKWPSLYNTDVKPYNSDDLVFTNAHPKHRLERNKHLVHMDKIHLFSIVTSMKPEVSFPIVDLLGICLMFAMWKMRKSKVWASVLAFALVKRWQKKDWASGSIFLGWLVSRHAKQSDAGLFRGFNKDHWEVTDGVVNSYSMICPRRSESVSAGMQKIPSHVSIDMANEEPSEMAKGQWHVYRVDKNHLCGTQFDQDAAELYLRLFRMLNEISRD
ncbi:Aste57867_21845 [Aphanomyces stellatus]|uniref:Aste57867_21845 protein n=1 Tax=Aphanomyces stellatus TaxID=120398 RepID=A0A485LJY0_9STRA|nr:hypothetical protein As57867_021776 [Aphanomyces stellatus]VFT98514.1 Aste57867_21845 [Aphanomyces stellatus]